MNPKFLCTCGHAYDDHEWLNLNGVCWYSGNTDEVYHNCRCMINVKLNKNNFLTLSRRIFYTYKNHANARGLSFELTLEQFGKFLSSICYYCGKIPLAVYKDPTVKSRKSILYNGVDRLDNNKGYFIGNIVTCCKVCNRMKSDMSLKDFFGHIDRVTKLHLRKRSITQ